MMNHRDAILALRSTLLSTVVATTGGTALAATGNGFTRADGSFVADGFRVGMEVIPAGFADNTPAVIKSVSALAITLFQERPVEVSAAARSLTVGIPALNGWENSREDMVDGRWYIDEDYLPGGSERISVALNGQMQHSPMYVLRLYGISGVGITAMYEVSDAIMMTFVPGLSIPMPDGKPLRVSSQPAPFRGQLLNEEAGRAVIVISIPLWKRTTNPI